MRKKVTEKYTQSPEKDQKKEKAKKEEEEEEEPKSKGKKEERKEIKRPERPEPILVHPPQPARPDKLLFPEMEQKSDYNFPPFTLLDPGAPSEQIDKNELYEKKMRIEEKLKEFRVEGEVKEYHPGPGGRNRGASSGCGAGPHWV